MMRDAATEAQLRAADPRTSTWLSANAGSGKTRVLTDRVARLLLLGVAPQHILCLTYTKAAATEMQNRLFATLGAWAMMPEADLRKALQALGHDVALSHEGLSGARQLFARAIESPGGLRIQTIHSFCATLLRRFPLEAGVSPAFTEMDERAAHLMQGEIVEEIAQSNPDVMGDLARHYTGDDFGKFLQEITANSDGFAAPLDIDSALGLFGLARGFDQSLLLAQVILGNEASLIAALEPYLIKSGANDTALLSALQGQDFATPNMAVLENLEAALLFKTGEKAFAAKLDSLPTKPVRGAMPADLLDSFNALMLRVEAARLLRLALMAAQKTAALHRFAAAFLPRYAAAKAARGYLDFDDLIARAAQLLTNPSVAAWVLFRLDGGIDHILVDEAQDTSPKQWQVIELLAAEFTAGEGGRAQGRTLFVVGDKKQSIYSFQGADIAVFDAKRAEFSAKFAAAGQPFQPAELEYSFRSSPAILGVVDNVFGSRFPDAMGAQVGHIAQHGTMAGRVDLWPVIEPAEKPDAISPTDTEARKSTTSAAWELAEKIAREVKTILDNGMSIPTKSGPRVVGAGDVLILVQRRSDMFHHIIRACKKLDLPIAGADRLRLGAEMAVRDLGALLSFLATPEDDLSLAAALRSPLLGLGEGQLYDLAQSRRGFLWEALRETAAHSDVLAMLNDLRDQSDFLRPYDLIERALTRHDGRRRLIARLGPEAEDGIDAFLAQALAFEQMEIPSLTGFLHWLETDDVTVKRQADSAGQRIRVMTVHGAKGLEAPIVILPDTADRQAPKGAAITPIGAGVLAWATGKDDRPPQVAAARETALRASERERLRLLYVALTRAQSWLIVAAAGKVTKPESWYNLVRQGLDAAGALPLAGGGSRHEYGDWPQAAGHQAAPPAQPIALPLWARQIAKDAPRAPQPFAPSRLSGAKTLSGEGEGDPDAMARGTAIHTLLEHLPQHPAPQWPALADTLLPVPLLPVPLRDETLAEATHILTAPDLAPLFAQGLAEVTIAAPLPNGQMLGVIDRLIVSGTEVLAIDYKSNQIVPNSAAETPAGLLAQMGAYHLALCQIYPNHRVVMAILWTKTAQLMQLDHDMMRDALQAAAIS